MSDLTWTPDTARLDSLELWERNPKTMSKRRAERLLKSWEDLGQYQTLAVGPGGECYDGHQRIKALRAAGYPGSYEVAVRRASRALTEPERERLIIESTVGTVGALNWDDLAAWDSAGLAEWGLDAEALATWNDDAANLALMLEADLFNEPQSLDELAEQYGEPEERDFWPWVKVQVSPETMEKYEAVMAALPGRDDAEKFDALVSGTEFS